MISILQIIVFGYRKQGKKMSKHSKFKSPWIWWSIVSPRSTAHQPSFEWSHSRISTDSKVRTTLHSIIINITGKYCSVAFIWRSKKISNSRQVVCLPGCIKLLIWSVVFCLFYYSRKKLTSLTQSIEQVFLSFFSFCLSRNAFDREYSLLSARDKRESAKYTRRTQGFQ